jgi:hypothetical protein
MPNNKRRDEHVEMAMAGLEKAVQKLIARYERRRRKQLQVDDDEELPHDVVERIQRLKRRLKPVLSHIRYCWTVLRQQLNALEIGLECFRTKLLPAVCDQLYKEKQSAAVAALTHLFQSFLQLHDGYILTVSG